MATLPPEMVSSLLQTARKTHARGDTARALVLLQMIAVQAPESREVWLVLADLAATPAQRLAALERLAALDPPHAVVPPRAAATPDPQPALEFVEVAAPNPPVLRRAPAVAPAATAEPQRRPFARLGRPAQLIPRPIGLVPRVFARWDRLALLILGLMAALVLIFFAVRPVPRPEHVAPPVTATAALAAIDATSVVATPAAPINTIVATVLPTAVIPQATATIPPTATPIPPLPPGAIIETGQWQIALLRPGDALVLDGSIGTVQPQGRFALALVAVINNGAMDVLPEDLIVLVDRQGRRFPALPELSRSYLDTFGRGVRGDLSQDERIPGAGVSVSVPLIFDIAADADDLVLMVGDAPRGWLLTPASRAPMP